eukprot:TRINITY_DN4747_c0_g1_i1.p1 TRINITY_DN4747_c0_g1~~TRINITY_DN4747_c0_g1_i1.p1  ORF type:complete len:1272 (+),score=176.66 TRINITY_DN4747_c0_g1_i1:75-3890(+)
MRGRLAAAVAAAALARLCSAACDVCSIPIQPGDIVITQMCHEACQQVEDRFTLLPLCDIPANTILRVTDNGWKKAGTWYNNEGWLERSFTTVVPAGQNIYGPNGWTMTANFDVAAAGDQIFVTTDNKTPLFGVHMYTWDADATSSGTSALPPGLPNVQWNLAYGLPQNNGEYDKNQGGIVRGSRDELLAAVQDASKWVTGAPGQPEQITLVCTEAPTIAPTTDPSEVPTRSPTVAPTGAPSVRPSPAPSSSPSLVPSSGPSLAPSSGPSLAPSSGPSANPSTPPTAAPTISPSVAPSGMPSREPTQAPSRPPSAAPSGSPLLPTRSPSPAPTGSPIQAPTKQPLTPGSPTVSPVPPTAAPSLKPSTPPTAAPSAAPSQAPSPAPSAAPTASPSGLPSASPSRNPSVAPSLRPSAPPTAVPSAPPSGLPSLVPSQAPSRPPSPSPSALPSGSPSFAPTVDPSFAPSGLPSVTPSAGPSEPPSLAPSGLPSVPPSSAPSTSPVWPPTVAPSAAEPPSASPSVSRPSLSPTPAPAAPSGAPAAPTAAPRGSPTAGPTRAPTSSTRAPSGQGGPTPPPSPAPSAGPSAAPSRTPTAATVGPSRAPARRPTVGPSAAPLPTPSARPSEPPSAFPSAPPTASPSGAIFETEAVQPRKAEAKGAMQGAAAAAAVAGPAPGMATLALLSEKPCGTASDKDEELPLLLHPLRFRIAGSMLTGCVVATCGLAVFFLFLHPVIRQALAPVLHKRGKSVHVLAAKVKWPGGALLVLATLYQGATYASMRLLLDFAAHDTLRVILGAVGLATLGIGVPAAVWWIALRKVPFRMVYQFDPERGRLRDFLLGPGEWCAGGITLFHERVGVVVRPYQPPWEGAAVLLQLAETGVISALAAWEKNSKETCGLEATLVAIVMMTHGGWCLIARPYARPRDQVYEGAVTAVAAGAMLSRSAGYFTGRDTFHSVSSSLLLAAMVVLGVKLVLDMLTALYIFKTQRRRRLQEIFTNHGADDAELLKTCSEYQPRAMNAVQRDADADTDIGSLSASCASYQLPQIALGPDESEVVPSPPPRVDTGESHGRVPPLLALPGTSADSRSLEAHDSPAAMGGSIAHGGMHIVRIRPVLDPSGSPGSMGRRGHGARRHKRHMGSRGASALGSPRDSPPPSPGSEWVRFDSTAGPARSPLRSATPTRSAAATSARNGSYFEQLERSPKSRNYSMADSGLFVPSFSGARHAAAQGEAAGRGSSARRRRGAPSQLQHTSFNRLRLPESFAGAAADGAAAGT